MAFFVVTYDLRKKDEFNYEKLWDSFKELDAVKYQESDYLLAANNTANDVLAHFKALTHPDDLLMVIEFSEKPRNTRGLQGTKAWIDAHWP